MSPTIHLLEPLAEDIEVETAAAHAEGVALRPTFVSTPEDIVAAADGADGIIVKFIEVFAETIRRLDGVRVIGRTDAGVDNIDLEAAAAASRSSTSPTTAPGRLPPRPLYSSSLTPGACMTPSSTPATAARARRGPTCGHSRRCPNKHGSLGIDVVSVTVN